jgi:hypothetical protein
MKPARFAIPVRAARGLLCCLVLFLAAPASAQLLAEVTMVAAASAQIDPAIRLPSGSFRVSGHVPPGLLAKVEGRSGYRDWEAYSARGLAARLFPAHRHQLINSFAMAGYFQQSSSERQLGREKHTQTVFVGSGGETALLYVIEAPDELVWLIARSN